MFRTRHLILVLTTFALLLVGCGGDSGDSSGDGSESSSGSTGGETTSNGGSSSSGDVPEACSLFTREEIAEAVGRTIQEELEPEALPDGASSCTYHTPASWVVIVTNPTNPDDFDLKVKGIFSTGEMTWETSGAGQQQGQPGVPPGLQPRPGAAPAPAKPGGPVGGGPFAKRS